MTRLDDLRRFYHLLSHLEKKVGGQRLLRDFSQYRDWPERGVYFFFEPHEHRSESGDGGKIMRVGTHAVTRGSRSTLRQRLSQHRGSTKGGGNHRGSIFRLLIGQAFLSRGRAQETAQETARDVYPETTRGKIPPCPSWGLKNDPTKAAKALDMDREELRHAEQPIEEAVSHYIGNMPFLWVDIGDEPSRESQRGYVERNAIALLSNHTRPTLDPVSTQWLGHHSNRPLVRESGLWNQHHVTEAYEPQFIETLDGLVNRMTS